MQLVKRDYVKAPNVFTTLVSLFLLCKSNDKNFSHSFAKYVNKQSGS